ncbi:MAG: tail fiber domain-containing protein [Bacteroidales bacterium]|nr:tail fiber domain-containing protein [Bacteroidales bacterium]
MNTNIITKGILATAVISALATGASAQQLPSSFNYQAVVNAEDGSPVAAKKITVEVSILQGTDCDKNSSCPVLWQELHYPTTSDFGLFSIEIGASDATNTLAGSCSQYSDIDWLDVSQGYYYLKVRADFGESEHLNSLSDLGVSKFSAVPYALVAQKTDFAANAGNAATATEAGKVTADANNKIPNKLAQLADVDVSSLAANQILVYDGTKWITKAAAASGASQLVDLSDVAVSSPTNGQVLTYNSTSGKWVNTTQTAATTITKLSQLTNESIAASPTAGQVVAYNGSKWANKALTLSDISNVSVNTTTLKKGHILTYNSTNQKWENTELSTDCPWKEVDEIAVNSTKVAGIVYKDKNKFTENGLIMDNYLIISAGEASGKGSIAINGKATELSTIALGSGCEAKHPNSMALGTNSITSAYNSLVIGKNNKSVTQGLFIIGNSNSEANRTNAFSVDANGVVEAAGVIKSNGTELTSDRRLKTNITPLEKSLDKVMKLNGVTFNWDKSNPKNANASTTLQYGFIAQEIEKVIPELVSETSDGYKTVNYVGVIPVLTQAIQEQQQEIEQLKEENKKLNDTLQELLKRVEALEKK